MSDVLQQAVMAIKTGDHQRAGQLLSQVLRADPRNVSAWVWLASIAAGEEKRRACLERALTIAPEHAEVQKALLGWILTRDGEALPLAKTSAPAPPRPTIELPAIAGASLQEFLLQLTKNYNLLKEREAKYGSTAAPLELLNQIEDYERATALAQEAIERAAPLEELQAEFGSLNLQISTVVFVAQEPPRKPFKGLNPYRGLLKFTEDDAQFFFGRTAAIQSLLNTVQYLVETETSQQVPDLIAVLGPSGSGKSSLVRAGLIPALWAGRIEGSQQWLLKVMLPGPHPLDALAQVFDGKVGQELAAIRASLSGGEKALHELIVESLALAKLPEAAVFVLVIDQFEETFTLCEAETECRAFIDQILYATQTRRNRTFIILTMRSDFYSKVAAYKHLAEVITLNQMLVSPMTEKELREAILLPAEAVGLELEKALVESLLRDTANAPGVLPLMQHALLELFHRREGNLLTLEAYNEIGGVKGALAHRADSVINQLTDAQQTIARRIFMRLVRPGEGTADTRRRANMTEVLSQDTQPQEVETIVKTLADANLIITDQNPETAEIVLDVSHEALITEWPLLRHWLNENRQSLRLQQELAEATRDWTVRSRSEDYLYQGARLLEVEEWSAAHPGELNPTEVAFIEASTELRDREQTEQEAQRQRELEQAQVLAEEQRRRAEEQAKASRRLRRLAAGLAVIFLLAVGAAVFGWVEQNRAEDQANLAQAQLWGIQGQEAFAAEPLLGLRLILEGWARLPAGESKARTSLEKAVRDMAGHGRLLRLGEGNVATIYSTAQNPSIFILALTEGFGELRRSADGTLVAALSGPVSYVDVSRDPTATYFIVGYSDDTPAELRRTADGTIISLFGPIAGGYFSPDPAATYFVVWYSDNTPTELRRTADGTLVAKLSGSGGPVYFSPDQAATYFVVPYSDNIPGELRRTADGTLVATLSGPIDPQVQSVSFSPDQAAAYFVVSYSDGTPAELRRTTDGTIISLSGPIATVDFSPDQAATYFVVSYSDDTPGELRRTADGTLVATLSGSGDTQFQGVTFSPDQAATYFTLYNIPNPFGATPGELRRTADGTVIPLSGPIANVDFSPDQAATSFVVSYSDDTPGELRRTADSTLVAKLYGPVAAVDFSPDQAATYFVVRYSDDTPAELRRTTDGMIVATLSGSVSSVTFSPDPAATYFAVSYRDNTPAELRRIADGMVVAKLSNKMFFITFSKDPAATYFVLTYFNEENELWQMTGQPRRLVGLGGLLDSDIVHFDLAHKRLVTRYSNGQAYLLDLAWLRAMAGQADKLPFEQVVKLACEGPFADKAVWNDATEAKLKEYLGERESQVCR